MATKAAEKNTGELASIPEAALERFRDMGNLIPETDTEGAQFAIIDQLMSADSLAALSAPWDEKDPDKLVGEELQFESVTRSASEYKDGLGMFLVVKAVKTSTGELITFSTGSVNIVAQLVAAHANGWFPFTGTIVRAEKASKNGYYPQHIRIAK